MLTVHIVLEIFLAPASIICLIVSLPQAAHFLIKTQTSTGAYSFVVIFPASLFAMAEAPRTVDVLIVGAGRGSSPWADTACSQLLVIRSIGFSYS